MRKHPQSMKLILNSHLQLSCTFPASQSASRPEALSRTPSVSLTSRVRSQTPFCSRKLPKQYVIPALPQH